MSKYHPYNCNDSQNTRTRTPSREPPLSLRKSRSRARRYDTPYRSPTRSRSRTWRGSRSPPRTPIRSRGSKASLRVLSTPKRSVPGPRQRDGRRGYIARSGSDSDSKHSRGRSRNRRSRTRAIQSRRRSRSYSRRSIHGNKRRRSDSSTFPVFHQNSTIIKDDVNRARPSNEYSLLEKLVNAIGDKNNRNDQGPGFHASQNIIPDFDPQAKMQTMKEWLAKIDESAHVYGWSERQTIFYALPKLRGLAKRWYDGLTSVKYTWNQWREKLLSAFPCEHNYADLLSEMLARRTRRNETLEEYYYDKIMLINRCELEGKKAVDCLTQGIFDSNIRMNVQGANLKDPGSVLQYFRNITSKVSDMPRRLGQVNYFSSDQSNKKSTEFSSRKPSSTSQITCYNCGEAGHIVSRCPKEVVRCKKCRQYGHRDTDCSRQLEAVTTKEHLPKTLPATNTKNILNIVTTNTGNDKYFKPLSVNGKTMTSFVDLGSQCTLLRRELGQELNLEIDYTNLPTLKGFASGTLIPLGRVHVQIALDGLDERVEAYLVDQDTLPADVLVGQSLTELPQVRACKTKDKIIFYKDLGTGYEKHHIFNSEDLLLHGIQTLQINTTAAISGSVYIDTEPCMKEGGEYLILPGIYSIKYGRGSVVVVGLSSEPFKLAKGVLLSRAALLSNTDIPRTEIHKDSVITINAIAIDETANIIEKEQIRMNDCAGTEVKSQLCDLLNRYQDRFAFGLHDLGKTMCTEMHIELKDQSPVTYRPYRLSIAEREKVNEIIGTMLASGIIRESSSEYASPIILVPKKSGEVRLCVDYRALNQKTIKEKFPMPLIDDQIDSLSEQVYFTTLDLTSGYHQVPVSEKSKHLTAFVTPDGHYEYNRMPFGLTNAPAVFQRLILKLLKQRKIPGVLAYMDDIIIPSKTIPEGMEKLQAVLDLLKEANLTLNLAKCNFFQTTIQYLGFEISSEGVRPGAEKTKAVADFKTPQTVHEVRQFIGLSSFFRRFVHGFATIARPLTLLTKANAKWTWGEEQDNAFKKLKDILITRPVLAIYNVQYDTELHTDASSAGLGSILLQRSDKNAPLRPVAYFSRQTTADEQRFHSYELETLAVVASLKRFRVYLIGIEFKIVTDRNALRTTLTKRDLIPRIARWWLLVQEYTFTIEYKPGSQMAHADALSRNAVPDNDNTLSVLQVGEVHWLQSVQMSDPRLCHIKAILDTKSPEAKDVHDNYVLKEGKIYRKVNGELRWAVPKDARWKILQQCHDDAGHFSNEKTLEKLRRDYWFPRMTQFAKKYVRACIPCAHAKQPGGKKQGLLHPIPKPSAPYQCLHMDHLGPFIKSKRGNLYILGIIDSFSKFIILRAVRNTKSKTTINVLRDIFALFGTPKHLISDRGTSFTSNEFKAYIESTGIKHTLNAVATPRANGQIERYNRSILASLTALCHDTDDRDWDIKVSQVQWSLNNTVNQTTNKSPTEILFGKPSVNVTEGQLHEIDLSEEISPETVEKIREEASISIQDQQEKMKTRYDQKRAKAKVYKVGDLVMIQKSSKTPGESHKLVPAFSGPYRVSAVLEHDRYEISSVEGYAKKKYTNVFSVDKMKPWVRCVESESESDYGDSE